MNSKFRAWLLRFARMLTGEWLKKMLKRLTAIGRMRNYRIFGRNFVIDRQPLINLLRLWKFKYDVEIQTGASRVLVITPFAALELSNGYYDQISNSFSNRVILWIGFRPYADRGEISFRWPVVRERWGEYYWSNEL